MDAVTIAIARSFASGSSAAIDRIELDPTTRHLIFYYQDGTSFDAGEVPLATTPDVCPTGTTPPTSSGVTMYIDTSSSDSAILKYKDSDGQWKELSTSAADSSNIDDWF